MPAPVGRRAVRANAEPFVVMRLQRLVMMAMYRPFLTIDVKRDGVVVNTLASWPRDPGFNSWSDRTLPSRSSCGQAVNDHIISDNGQQNIQALCFLDLSAVFDTIDHSIYTLSVLLLGLT